MTETTFVLDVDATGIDPLKDRVIYLCAHHLKTGDRFKRLVGQSNPIPTSVIRNLKISPSKLSNAKSFKNVMHDLLTWMTSVISSPDGDIYIVSGNGHRFVFPILTKEMRRYKTSIKNTFVLWDTLYTLHRFPPVEDTSALSCDDRVDRLLSSTLFNSSGSKNGLDLLREDNEKYIAANPQSVTETKHIRIN